MMEDKKEILNGKTTRVHGEIVLTENMALKSMDEYWNIAIDRCIVVVESFSGSQSIANQMRMVELKHRLLQLKKEINEAK